MRWELGIHNNARIVCVIHNNRNASWHGWDHVYLAFDACVDLIRPRKYTRYNEKLNENSSDPPIHMLATPSSSSIFKSIGMHLSLIGPVDWRWTCTFCWKISLIFCGFAIVCSFMILISCDTASKHIETYSSHRHLRYKRFYSINLWLVFAVRVHCTTHDRWP